LSELYVRVSTKCCGYALCVEICPEVFEADDSGFAHAGSSAVPRELVDRTRESAEMCPEEAIDLSDTPFDD
jgi:ferredoxin